MKTLIEMVSTKLRLALIFILLSCNSTTKETDSGDIHTNKAEESSVKLSASEIIKAHMKGLDIPGVQIAVSSGGKLIWSESFGYADVENRIPVTNSTTFRLGSVSKSLTGAAVGVLLQQNKLSLDSSIGFYVPSFPKKRWPITIAQLAGHTSGIRHYNSVEEVNSLKHYTSVMESLEQFSSDSLLFEPGSQMEYSSFGYTLLSGAIESAGKQPFPKFIQENVFSPLGMNSTTMDYADKNMPERSKFYVMDDRDKRVFAPSIDNSNKWAAGGMISTAEDLVKFGSALLDGSFLRNDITAKLFASMKTKDGNATGYGIGWQIKTDANGRKVIVSDGSLPSARSVLLMYPDEKLVLAILMNTGSSIFFNKEEAMMLADLFLNPSGSNPGESDRKKVIGDYIYATSMEGEAVNGIVTLSEEKGQLKGTMTIPNQFFKERQIPVHAIKIVGDEISMIGLPGNWISIKFINSKEGIKGSWRFGPITGELTGHRK